MTSERRAFAIGLLSLAVTACGGRGATDCPETTSGSEAPRPQANGVTAPQPVPDLSGTWQTVWGDVPGDAIPDANGASEMLAINRQNGIIFTYGEGHTMVCAMDGARCSGTWVGGSGSGWLDVTFDPSGRAFTGTWGYGPTRGAAGSFTGQR